MKIELDLDCKSVEPEKPLFLDIKGDGRYIDVDVTHINDKHIQIKIKPSNCLEIALKYIEKKLQEELIIKRCGL